MTETNPDALQNIRITLFKNNQTIILQEGTDYRIEVRGGNGQWYEYIYTVLAKNFADDGVYRLTFYSEDAAGNIAENTLDTKKQEIGFGVDKTKPNMVVTNLESDTTYPLENLTGACPPEITCCFSPWWCIWTITARPTRRGQQRRSPPSWRTRASSPSIFRAIPPERIR